jgi:phosphoribosyl-dephospho-CoA transferase
MIQALRRHSLVWLDQELDVTPYVTPAAHAAVVTEWVAEGLPFVSARQPGSDTGDTRCSLGLTLPPPATRQRVSLLVPPTAIIKVSEPLEMARALDVVDHHCRELLRKITRVSYAAGMTPHVYGSLMWQAVSGKRYMTETSDLDILFCCHGAFDSAGLLAALEGMDGSLPRLDGEILAPTGWAAAWRELAAAAKLGGNGTVLAKSDNGVKLLPLTDFWGRNDG